MGDEGELIASTANEENSQVNQDELIIAQQRQIEKEVSFSYVRLCLCFYNNYFFRFQKLLLS